MKHRKKDGFTLVEMAIVLLIFGTVVTTIMFILRFYTETQKRERTLAAMDSMQSALSDYRTLLGRYPCPADPGVPQFDATGAPNPDYGLEAVDAAGNCLITGAIKQVTGERDADDDGTNDNILIGTFPFQSILNIDLGSGGSLGDLSSFDSKTPDLSAKTSLDGWSKKVTYAVTQNLTDEDSFSENAGAIEILNEFDQSVLKVPASAHYVLVSHGDNGRGAYNTNGKLIENCVNSVGGELPPPIKNGNENENCDENDGIFLLALPANDDSARRYDDIVRFHSSSPLPIWLSGGFALIDQNGTPGDPTDDIRVPRTINTNPGSVGVGLTDPEEKLHVDGDIQASKILAEQLCDPDGGICMTSETIAGEVASMKCREPGQVVLSIENEKVNCVDPFEDIPLTPCAPPKRMVGLSSASGVICE